MTVKKKMQENVKIF